MLTRRYLNETPRAEIMYLWHDERIKGSVDRNWELAAACSMVDDLWSFTQAAARLSTLESVESLQQWAKLLLERHHDVEKLIREKK